MVELIRALESDIIGDDTELEFIDSTPADPEKYDLDTCPESSIHYNLRTLSYSGFLTFLSCERRFEVNRLTPPMIDVERDEDEKGHLDFGTIVGNGIQELLIHGNLGKAHFRAFLDWNDNLESDRGEGANKTFWHALQAISKFMEVYHGPLSAYELATFNGKPAVELGFKIDCGNGFTYRGKLDALLIHKIKREFLPLECKTTGWKYLNEAMYGNSAQGIGYGVVIDRVAHEMEIECNSYDVLYPVYMTSKSEWEVFRFPKSNTSRALWLQTLLMDIRRIELCHDLGYFPQRGSACFSFGKECKHYGQCHLANEEILGPVEKLPVRLDKKDEYPLKFTLEALIEAQVGKL